MILDKISNFEKYRKMFPEIAEIIQGSDLLKFQTGYTRVNESLYFLVNEYDTSRTEKIQYENHRKYVDIQLLLKGEEKIAFAKASTLKIIKMYDNNEDYELMEGKGDVITLHCNDFIIFFPGEAHHPGITSLKSSSSNKKVIFKLKLFNYAG